MNYKYILSGITGALVGGASVYFYMKKQLDDSADAMNRERAVTKSKLEESKSINSSLKPDLINFANELNTDYNTAKNYNMVNDKDLKEKAETIVANEEYVEVEEPTSNRVQILKEDAFFDQIDGMDISANILTSDLKLIDRDYAVDYELQDQIGKDILRQFHMDENSDELFLNVNGLYVRIVKYDEDYRTLTGIDIDSYR